MYAEKIISAVFSGVRTQNKYNLVWEGEEEKETLQDTREKISLVREVKSVLLIHKSR